MTPEMNTNKRFALHEFVMINNAISTLAILCAYPRHKIVELLTGKLWEQYEAVEILEEMKRTDGGFYPIEIKFEEKP